jgi:hypothetical protein
MWWFQAVCASLSVSVISNAEKLPMKFEGKKIFFCDILKFLYLKYLQMCDMR